MQDWIETLSKNLRSEWSYAEQEHQRCRSLSGVEQVALGLVWPVMRLSESTRLRGQKIELWLRVMSGVLHDGITAGDTVTVAPSLNAVGLRGVVASTGEGTATVVVEHDELPSWLQKGDIVVGLAFDDRTYRYYAEGLSRCAEQDNPALLQALYSGLDSEEKETKETKETKVYPTLSRLDPSQKHAATQALNARSLALIHGPPGTGKTHTICAILAQIEAEGGRPLALADSNAAVDNLTRGLVSRGHEPLRLGSRYRIAPDTKRYSLWGRIAAHPQQTALVALERDIRRSSGREKGQLVREVRKMRRQVRAEIIANAPIITSTLGTMSREIIHLNEPHTAIIDEATQAIEPAIWALAPFLKRLIVVGDPKQLGPVVMQPGNRLELSLMTRLVERDGVDAPMLSVQRRMSNTIMQLVHAQYGDAYQAHSSVAEQRLTQMNGLLQDCQALWIDTAGYEDAEEEKDELRHSFFNACEVSLVVRVVQTLRNSGVADADIGIIAPYSAQVARIQEAVEGIEVATVNAYQGREKSVIICSFVRSNMDGVLGFVRDARRLTVAASRAQHLWIGIGDSGTLGYDPSFQSIFDVLAERGTWQTVWDWEFETD